MSDAVDGNAEFRAKLGGRLVIGASTGVILLGLVVIGAAAFKNDPNNPNALKDAAQLIFTAILPLLGTWVGTVLAFYYTKENFESASRTTLDAVRSGAQRLETTRVADKMMPAAAVVKAAIPAGKKIDELALKDVGDLFDKLGPNGQKISRLLIVDDGGACVGIIHRSVWMEMLNLGLQQTPPANPATDSLGKLLPLPYTSPVSKNFGDFIGATVTFVGLDRTVADAKAAMEAKSQCQDVIVTATGKSDEPMRGWISNIDIMRLSQA